MCNTKVNPSVNCGLKVGRMCQFCHKCTTLVGGVGNGGGCAWLVAGMRGTFLYLPVSLAVTLKLLKITKSKKTNRQKTPDGSQVLFGF